MLFKSKIRHSSRQRAGSTIREIMKNLFILVLVLSFSTQLLARGGKPDTKADYIVPTPSEFIPYSRFKVKIVDRFEGDHTQKISYIFPEFLVGEAERVISLLRVPGTKNSWTSPELDAHCVLIRDDFSCNIYGKKNTNKNIASISAEQAISHLPRLNLSKVELKGLTGVINSFYSHEPAGFLSYDID